MLQGGRGGQCSRWGRGRSGFVVWVVRLGLCILRIVVVGNADIGFGGVGVREKALATFMK